MRYFRVIMLIVSSVGLGLNLAALARDGAQSGPIVALCFGIAAIVIWASQILFARLAKGSDRKHHLNKPFREKMLTFNDPDYRPPQLFQRDGEARQE